MFRFSNQSTAHLLAPLYGCLQFRLAYTLQSHSKAQQQSGHAVVFESTSFVALVRPKVSSVRPSSLMMVQLLGNLRQKVCSGLLTFAVVATQFSFILG